MSLNELKTLRAIDQTCVRFYFSKNLFLVPGIWFVLLNMMKFFLTFRQMLYQKLQRKMILFFSPVVGFCTTAKMIL